MRSRGKERYCLSCWKELRHSSYQWKFLCWQRVINKGSYRSTDLETKKLRVATFLAKDWTFFIVFRGESSNIARIFSRLSLIPLCDTMNPRNLSKLTLKAHLVRLSLIPYFIRVTNVSFISAKYVAAWLYSWPPYHLHKFSYFCIAVLQRLCLPISDSWPQHFTVQMA